MSYAAACYAIVVASVLAYAAWLGRERRRLASEVASRPETNRG